MLLSECETCLICMLAYWICALFISLCNRRGSLPHTVFFLLSFICSLFVSGAAHCWWLDSFNRIYMYLIFMVIGFHWKSFNKVILYFHFLSLVNVKLNYQSFVNYRICFGREHACEPAQSYVLNIFYNLFNS